MKNTFTVFSILLLGAVSSFAQQSQTGGAKASAHSATTAEAGRNVTVDSGAEIRAEMMNGLNLKTAKPGQPFKMRTTKAVKKDGATVINSGSIISGHVEQVTRSDNEITGTLVFDEILDRKTGVSGSIDAVITAVTRVQTPALAERPMSDEPTRRNPQPQREQSGGLLGGVTGTVGGVAGQVGATVDSTTSATAGAGKTTSGLAGSTIRIIADTTANATSGSTLALQGGQTRVDTGTSFVLKTTSALMLTRTKRTNPKN